MVLLHEKDDHNHEDKRSNKIQERQSLDPVKANLTGGFVIEAKFGGHVLHHLADRVADKNFSLSNFYLKSVFGSWWLFNCFKCYIWL